MLYQIEKLAQRARFASLPAPENGWPILLSISFPKSGTHLLDQVLSNFNRIAPFSLRALYKYLLDKRVLRRKKISVSRHIIFQ